MFAFLYFFSKTLFLLRKLPNEPQTPWKRGEALRVLQVETWLTVYHLRRENRLVWSRLKPGGITPEMESHQMESHQKKSGFTKSQNVGSSKESPRSRIRRFYCPCKTKLDGPAPCVPGDPFATKLHTIKVDWISKTLTWIADNFMLSCG